MGRMPDTDRSMGFGRQTQSAIYRAGASGAGRRSRSAGPICVARAERAMSAEAWAYVHGSSGVESTAEANATPSTPGGSSRGCCATSPTATWA